MKILTNKVVIYYLQISKKASSDWELEMAMIIVLIVNVGHGISFLNNSSF